MDIENIIRKISKRPEQQNIFSVAKELNGIKLFKNEIDFSHIQQIYLSYLYFYYDLNMDIVLKKIDEKSLKNFIREDSYSYYKKNKEPESNTKDNNLHLVMTDPKKVKYKTKEAK